MRKEISNCFWWRFGTNDFEGC